MASTTLHPTRDRASVGEVTGRLTEHTREVLHDVRPRLRGWLHAATAPAALVAGGVLLLRAPDEVRPGLGVFIASAVVLFGVSALYHSKAWSPRVKELLRRIDHANIFLHIAATYTAFSMLLLEPERATRVLTVVWVATALGVVFRVGWVDAPRWLHTPAYVLVGSVAVLFTADFTEGLGSPTFTMMIAGGALYLVGALVYGVQRPNPLPRWFGFHEVFHAFTVAAFAMHFIGLSVGTHALA